MMQGIVNRAQRSVDLLVTKYVTRIAVAVPFVIALGFGTAAASAKLAEMYGSIIANSVLAATFCLVGLIAASVIALSGPKQAEAVTGADATTAAAVGMKEAAVSQDLLLTTLAAVGPAALPAVLRLVFRNLPVMLAVAVILYILFSQRSAEAGGTPANDLAI